VDGGDGDAQGERPGLQCGRRRRRRVQGGGGERVRGPMRCPPGALHGAKCP
jgi:hypothetical protein